MDALRWKRVPVDAPKHAPPAGPSGFCWATPKGWMVGTGVAAEVSASGPERLRRLRLHGGRWVGGFAFEDEVHSPWQAFGAARFFAPRALLIVENGRAEVQLAWRDGERCPQEEAEAWVESAAPAVESVVESVERPSAEAHLERVRAGLDHLRSGQVAKVVISRDTVLRGRFDPQSLWARLPGEPCEHARFALFADGQGLLGQTPECLVRRDGQWLCSEALAGSAALSEADALLERAKDKEEHARVVEAVRAALEDLGVLDAMPAPSVRRLRAIAHLWTPIRVRSSASILDAAARLHPTPATGGAPTEAALSLLRRLEGRPRGWYCGAVGWLDGDGGGDLRVALRSVLVDSQTLRLFVGGGIMADSDPEQEWAETMLKEEAVVSALGLTLP